MRRAARIDDNQTAIVKALRKAGCSVLSLAAVGGGVPDLLVGRAKQNYLMEIKDGDKSPSRRKLNNAQHIWHTIWEGEVDIVKNKIEALRAVGL